MTRLLVPTANVTVAGNDATPTDGAVTLDETTVYAQADFTIPLLDLAEIEDIDPRESVRSVITLGLEAGGTRTFDLGIRTRVVDHVARNIKITCASDEALLADYAPLVADLTPLASTSLRAVVNYVLGVVIPGAALEAAPADDALTTMLDVDNLVTNPSLEVDAAGWSAYFSGTGTAARTTGTTPEGAALYRASYTSSNVPQTGPFYTVSGVKPGTAYTASVWMRPSVYQNLEVRLEWKNAVGVTISAVTGPMRSINAGVWARLIISNMVAPPLADRATITMYAAPSGVSWVNGNTLDVDGLRLGPTQSEPLTWPAGTSAWDYLLSLTSAAQLRLFCDEQRKWRLVPMDYAVTGVVAASPATSKSGDDTISRDGDLWADGVIARYRWQDADGTSQEYLDTAGVPGKVQVIEFERPYPGSGAAAFRLNRLKGQGRLQRAVAFADYAATPGMEARVTLPGTYDQVGRVQSITFPMGDPYMDIGSRSLTDVPPTSYIFGAPGVRYADVPVGMDYDTFDWTGI